MVNDIDIKVPIQCSCGKKLLMKKKQSTVNCSVRCPACGKETRLKFNIQVDPQTYQIVDDSRLKETVPVNRDTAQTNPTKKPRPRKVTVLNGPVGPFVPPPPGPVVPKEQVDPFWGQPCEATLTQLKMFRFTAERFQLKYGETTVGRFDVAKQSDIPVKGDAAISRRSIVLKISKYGSVTEYRLIVKSATNPVKVNSKVVAEGEDILLDNGDIIKLGNTKFRFETNVKK